MTCCPEPNCLGSQHSCNIDAFKHTPSHFLKLVRYSKGKKNDEITAWFWNRSMLHVDCYFLRDIACFDVHSTCLNTFFCFFLQTIIFPMKGSSWSSLYCSVLTVSSGVMWLILAPTSDFLGRQNFCSFFFKLGWALTGYWLLLACKGCVGFQCSWRRTIQLFLRMKSGRNPLLSHPFVFLSTNVLDKVYV